MPPQMTSNQVRSQRPVMMLWTAPTPGRASALESVADEATTNPEELIMQSITAIGLDIAKSVFQVHGVGGRGSVVIRRQLKRRYVLAFFKKLPPCLVGIEACATSHHWSRELQALGHTVRLIPPAYVKPYVKRQKNDAADACAWLREIQQPVVSARRITNIYALQHLLDNPKIPGIANKIYAEFPLSRAAKRHVVPQDVILMATGIDDGRE